MKAALSFAAFVGLPVAALIGAAVYDRSETTLRYESGRTWNGDSAVFEYQDGRLMRGTESRTVGLFSYGRPRLVAFDCEGMDSPLIAMEESDLPRCGRIEPIANFKPAVEWASR